MAKSHILNPQRVPYEISEDEVGTGISKEKSAIRIKVDCPPDEGVSIPVTIIGDHNE
jgi:hypothetical protein